MMLLENMMFSPVSWDGLVLVLIEGGEIAVQNELYTDECYLKEKKPQKSHLYRAIFECLWLLV